MKNNVSDRTISKEIDTSNELKIFITQKIPVTDLRINYYINLKTLSSIVTLRSISIGLIALNDSDIKKIRDNVSQLSHLKLFQCQNLTNDSIEYIGEIKNLQRLTLFSLVKVTDEGIKHLQNLKNLLYLDIRDGKLISDFGLAYILSIRSLKQLSLTLNKLHGAKITDNGLENLSNKTNLLNLNLEGGIFTDRGLSYISTCTNLVGLNISNCSDLTTEGIFQCISSLKNINFLYLYGTGFEGPIKKLVKFLPKLQILYGNEGYVNLNTIKK